MTFDEFMSMITGFINGTVTPLLISVAVLVFFYHTGAGLFKGTDNTTARSKLRETLMWGVAIIFVMVAITGIIHMIGGELNIMNANPW